jgi:acyl-CoA synthetase (AMP-forming)/AMP-acid ligase II
MPASQNRTTLRHERHYGGRVVRCFAPRPANVDAMFRQALSLGPDRPAVTLGERTLSYGALDDLVARCGGGLTRLGIARGDRVALLLGNNLEFVIAVLACARLGIVAVPMNQRQKAAETAYMLGHCGAVALVFDAGLAPVLPAPGECPGVKHEIVVGEGSGRDDALPFDTLLQCDPASGAELAEEDLFCLLYTSGTTGRPKGAMLTHLGVVHSCLHYEGAFGLRQDDVAILAVPASHVTGLVAVILAMVNVGGHTVIMPAFKAAEFIPLAERVRMTYTLVVPAIYNLCLLQPDFASRDLSSWRVGGFGGAPMPQATITRLAGQLPGLGLYNIYGSTETTSPVTVLPSSDIAGHSDSVGLTLPCCDVIVVDDDGIEVPRGQSGELWIAGANVVPGYWADEPATAKGFTAGYWMSGDIGSMDEAGYVRVFDRKKDVVNRGGFKIYSIEVENELARHPAVLECAVTGRPDSVLGERVEAFVVPRPGVEIAGDELKAHCARSLSDYKVPDIVTVLPDALPRNANGKVLKAELRRLAQERG